MFAYLSIVVMLIGFLIYMIMPQAFPGQPQPTPAMKMAEVGRIMLFCGLLAFLLPFGEKLVNLLR